MLTIRPESLLNHLEFDKIANLLLDLCLIEDTRYTYFPLKIETNKSTLDLWLDQVLEFKSAWEHNEMIPLRTILSITASLELLSIEDYTLEQEALYNVLMALSNLHELSHFFEDSERSSRYPITASEYKNISYQPGLYKEFRLVFDDHGQIRPDASPGLKNISRSIKAKEYDIDQVFKSLLGEYRKNGWLSESGESIRNNRRVVAVSSEHKRKIKGIIHDESATGKTTFIEPELIIEKNNELFDLEMDYQKELYRIFKALSHNCHLQIEMVHSGWKLLIHFDFIRAKALLGTRYHGYRPEIFDRPQLKIKGGKHPLLFIKNNNIKRETIAFDLVLLGENRILILSGPNAGGKSVAMKATVLIQLMLQTGMLIPVHEASEMGIFHSFLGDIGDHQSLEEDLSTYSSRLLIMKQFLEVADERSLICIDEFGSGTDPKLGGAIAEALLLAINKRKSFGVITTHYSNLKILAFKTNGLINGAMVFDTEHLKPTFALKVGRPGSSYAFEVAYRSGLDPSVIEHAKKRTDQDQKELEELLIELQRDKLQLEDQLKVIKEKEDGLDRLVKSYDSLTADFELRRKKLKLDQKTWEINASKELSYKIERTIKEIKSAPHTKQNISKKHLDSAKEQIHSLESEVSILDKEIQLMERVHSKPIGIGSFVRMKNGSEIGKVMSIRNSKAEVAMGSMIMNIMLRD
ncbi:MAG: endonuclease MutS2, partial [Saprospiraceae bacterium]